MADPAGSTGGQRMERSSGGAPGVPGWVKVLGAVIGGLVVLAVILQLTGIAGQHGPGRHGPRLHGGTGEQADSPPIDGAPVPAIGSQRLAFEPARVGLSAGSPVNVALTSGDMLHDLVVDEIGLHVAAASGQTVTGGLVFDNPGTYVGCCSVAGHREAGMEMLFVVAEPDQGHRQPDEH